MILYDQCSMNYECLKDVCVYEEDFTFCYLISCMFSVAHETSYISQITFLLVMVNNSWILDCK